MDTLDNQAKSPTSGKKGVLLAPVTGRVMDITKVPDPVFAEKMTGDGIAIDLENDTVYAPCDGEISLFFDTKHAFVITNPDGIQVLTHVGIDTLLMNGRGITALTSAGAKVKAGDPIIKLDLPLLEEHHICLVSPLIIVNVDKIKGFTMPKLGTMLRAGKDVGITYELR